MSHTGLRQSIDEWEVEICGECGHEKSFHYDQPVDINFLDGSYMYTAEGCISMLRGGRKLRGDNPYPRCLCMKFV